MVRVMITVTLLPQYQFMMWFHFRCSDKIPGKKKQLREKSVIQPGLPGFSQRKSGWQELGAAGLVISTAEVREQTIVCMPSAQLDFYPLTQSRAQSQGIVLPMVACVLPDRLIIRDMVIACARQFFLSLSYQTVQGCVKLIFRANHQCVPGWTEQPYL